MEKQIKESHLRSLFKGVSWRLAGTVTTIFIAYCITRDPLASVKIGALEIVVKIFAYYLHERVWAFIPLR